MDLGLGRSPGLGRMGGLDPVVVSRYIYDLASIAGCDGAGVWGAHKIVGAGVGSDIVLGLWPVMGMDSGVGAGSAHREEDVGAGVAHRDEEVVAHI